MPRLEDMPRQEEKEEILRDEMTRLQEMMMMMMMMPRSRSQEMLGLEELSRLPRLQEIDMR